MKKIYLRLNQEDKDYFIFNNSKVNHQELYILAMALEPLQNSEVMISEDKKGVLIWSLGSFKKPIEIKFSLQQEEDAFEEAYDRYYDKRWDEMPQVDLSWEDWYKLKEKWQHIKKEQPEYVVFELDDSDSLDKVDVYEKNELSQEDINYIEQEHEKYLKYEKARRKYIQNHPDYSEVWRGPQDDEYEADIMKYHD